MKKEGSRTKVIRVGAETYAALKLIGLSEDAPIGAVVHDAVVFFLSGHPDLVERVKKIQEALKK